MRALALGVGLGLVLAACTPPAPSLSLDVAADVTLAKVRIVVYDTKAKKLLRDSNWLKASKIGLEFNQGGDVTVVILGTNDPSVALGSGDHPAADSLWFFADRFTVTAGNQKRDARLVQVPPTDDVDADLWPSTAFATDVAAAAEYSARLDLLDCDDMQAQAHPFAAEVCGNMVDEDCDGATPACADSDGDGDPDDTDCKPMDPTIHHPTTADPFPESTNCCGRNLGKTGSEASMVFGAPLCHASTCGDSIDQDCDGQDTKCERDNDCDGELAAATMQVGADGGPACNAPANDPPGTDCNDCDPAIGSKAPELCDGIDNNCNGVTDETCVSCDLDGDGFQRMDAANACPDAFYVAAGKPIDCNDDDAGVFPGSTSAMFPLRAPLSSQNCKGKEGGSVACALRQACNKLGADGNLQDVDCNGNAGQGCPPATCDVDGDGFIDSTKKSTCDPGGTLGPYDCDDTDPHTFPGAPDKCGDTLAQNCATDTVCGVDADHDGYDTTTDCDDSDASVHPWATEICDGKDNDCDGLVDEGNPDGTGAAMYDNVAKTVLRCNDSNVGECAKKVNNAFTGRCVCSPSTLQGLIFAQLNRVACPGETQMVDSSTASAARCYGAYQPQPQSCEDGVMLDEDCDGRFDDPTGTNLALKGTDCWSAALGECRKGSGTNSGAKVVGCDRTKKNCFAAFAPPIPGVRQFVVCDNPASCPVAEKCNGLDDDCNGMTPVNEQDQDGDFYIACWNGTGCDLPLKQGLLGCGDCQDGAGMTAIHPNAVENCNNVNDDCDVACDAMTHQCAAMATGDGAGQCGKGANTALPTCCSNQSACRDLQTDYNSCGVCTLGHVSNCTPLTANTCMAGGCSCGASGAPCAAHSWCNAGTCQNCGDDTHCGNACVTCSGSTHCKTDETMCVQCTVDADCAGFTCNNGVCNTTCTANSGTNCDSTHYCNATGNACLPRKTQGISCTAGANYQCLTGNCVDGVCCDKPQAMCNGCQQCNLGTSLGTCTNVPSGQDPHGLCPANASNCVLGGCNGTNACTPSTAGTSCATPVCNLGGDDKLTVRTCNGTATGCPAAPPPAFCVGDYSCANASSCRTTCTMQSHCRDNTIFCCGAGQCRNKTANAFCGNGCVNCTAGTFDKACYTGTKCGCPNGDGDCGGTKPVCDVGTRSCVACGGNADCHPDTVKCTTGVCGLCVTPNDCSSAGMGAACNGSGMCTCASMPDCTNPRAPNCIANRCRCSSGVVCPYGQTCSGGTCI